MPYIYGFYGGISRTVLATNVCNILLIGGVTGIISCDGDMSSEVMELDSKCYALMSLGEKVGAEELAGTVSNIVFARTEDNLLVQPASLAMEKPLL